MIPKLVIPSRVQKLKLTCMKTRNTNVAIEILSLKKVLHISHQLYPLNVLANDGDFYLHCTKTNFPRSVRLSSSTEHETEGSELFAEF